MIHNTSKRNPGLSTEKKALLERLKAQKGIASNSVPSLKPVDREGQELFPLSFAQQRLWLLDQLDPNTTAYTIPLVLRLRGNVQYEALRNALQEVIQRHEALRTAFIEVDGVPWQKVLPAGTLTMPFDDLSAYALDERKQQARRLIAQQESQPFDLSTGPLLRASLLHMSEDEYLFAITIHHIAFDEWSVEIFFQEMQAYYAASLTGETATLSALPVQYVDYAHWQREWLQGEVLEKQLDYWKKQLQGLPPLLQLPADRPRPAVQTSHGGSCSFQLAPELVADLKALGQREDATLFMTLLTAFQVWLCRHTEREDIAVGTPIANRSHSDLDRLIGFFVNTLVLRTDLAGNPDFLTALRSVRNVTLEAFNYREVPFEMVVDALQPERNLSYSPLFQVLFTLQSATTPASSSASSAATFTSEQLAGEQSMAKFDLSLKLSEEEEHGQTVLTGNFDYNSDLFDAATVERFVQRFLLLLQEIVKQPEQGIRDLALIPTEEYTRIQSAVQESEDIVQDVCLHELFEVQAERTPDVPALIFEDTQLSYEQLNRRANQLAHYLRQLGVGPEVRVGLCMERGWEMVVALLGILKAGGAYVPLDPDYPTERLSFLLTDAQAAVLLTQQQVLPRLPETMATTVCLDAAWERIAYESEENPRNLTDSQNMAYVIYTSGSTGQPKGVVVRHSSLVNLTEGLDQMIYAQSGQTQLRVGLNGPLTFDTSVKQIVQLLYGHTLVIVPQEMRFDANELSAYLKRHQVNVIDCTPLHLHYLLMQGLLEDKESTLHQVLIGGAAIDETMWQTLARYQGQAFYNLYGPTECTVDATIDRVQSADQRPSIGRPLPNVEVSVLDAYLHPVPIGVPGELYIGGSGLARGYFNRADLTAERFVPDPQGQQQGARLYRTGDRARWLADGNLEYLGRLDYQVKIRGVRVEPEEVEQTLLQQPGVRECVVIAHADNGGAGQSLVAYIVPQAETSLSTQDLRTSLRGTLPDYMQPAFYELLTELPRSVNGKVDRQSLSTLQLLDKGTQQPGQSPRNPREEKLAEIWREVLNREVADIRANFFEIGGHSLLAMQVIARIRTNFQIELPLRVLFERPTIEGLAEALLLASDEDESSPVTAVKHVSLPDYMQANFNTKRRVQPTQSAPRSLDTEPVQGPRNPQEEALSEIWREVLGREVADIRADFFEIGGHSLLAMQVIARIRAVFQVELPLRRLFERPTIEGLAEAILLARDENNNLLEPPVKRVARDYTGMATAPISFAQQRLWILDRLNPGKSTYNMPLALHLSGPVDREALELSLCEIVARHAVLRTTFPIKDDTPVQAITPAAATRSLSFTDLSGLSETERLAEAQRMITEEAQQPFDLEEGPLMRTQLLKVDETNYVLLMTLHHIASDGWSMNILKRELFMLYRAFSAGQSSPLTPLPVQYADYAIWQRQWLQGAVLDRQLRYWREQLAGAPDVLPLPTDRPRGAVQSQRGGSYPFEITPAMTARLTDLGKQTGTTLFMVLLAAFQTFLARVCNQDDIIVGTPIANRTHTEIEGLIGFFVNTLVMRTDFSGHPDFLEIVGRVRRVVLDALTHQDLPFEQIVEAVQPERNLLRSPIFQVMFVLQTASSREEIDYSPLSVSFLDVEQTTAKFDLILALTPHDEGLRGELEYNADLFERETIARLAEHFQVLLTGLVNAPGQPVEHVSLLSKRHYQQIVVEANNNAREYPRERLIVELIEERAATAPESKALSARNVEMTYGELNRRANQLAHYLQTAGVAKGDIVGIYLPRTLDMVVSLLAVLKAGAAYLPLDPTTPAARTTFILEDAGARLLITGAAQAVRLKNHQVPMLYLEKEATNLQAQSEENLPLEITPEYPAYVIYTSGSTGNPKGVVIEHKALLNLIYWYQETHEVTAQDKATHLANLGFDASVFELWPFLASGSMVYLVDDSLRLSPTALMPWLVQKGITICFLPTSMVEMMINRQWPAQTALRLLMTGGDALQRTPAEHLPFTLVNHYGPTENTVAATWAPIPPAQQQVPTIGRAMANVQVYVLNRAGEPQPIGVPGELYLGGRSVAQGYLHRPDLTAERFVPDAFSSQPGARLYKTGDMVRLSPDGTLKFLGRLDTQVKIRGYRIELGEIEAVLLSHADVREAVVVVNESLPGEKRLAAYIIAKEGTPLAKEGLLRLMRDRLPDYMVPTSLSIIEAFPLTAHGKVDRQALARRRPINTVASDKYVAPRDAIELQLAQLWEKLLGVSPIGMTDNFFQLGGHSLTGVRLMSQIHRLFGMELPLSTLFEHANITALASVLRKQEKRLSSTPLVEIQSAGSRPPLFCVHPAGGEVLCYQSLARRLGSDQPLYGLQAAELHRQEQAPSIEEMATYYRDAIRAIQPEGPYFLGGWSMGGVIAFEMARQFEAEGQRVAFVGLFDSHLPSRNEVDNNEEGLLNRFMNDLAGMSNLKFSQAAENEEPLEHLLFEAQRMNILPPSVDAAYIKSLFVTFKKNLAAISRYQPESYSGRITLFPASAFTSGEQVEVTYGWHRFAAQVDAGHVLPGDHYTILRDPQVEVLAGHLLSCMQETEVALSSRS